MPFTPPKKILSDKGTEYVNPVFKEICCLLKIPHNTSTSYHHETLGAIERSHRTLNEYLRSYINEDQTDWDIFSKYFAFCHNITPNDSFQLKFTPFELMFCRKVNIPNNLTSNYIEPLYNVDSFAKRMKFTFQKANKIARDLINKAKEKNKLYYDREIKNQFDFKLNDIVLIPNENRKKLDPLYKGPYLIKEILGLNVLIENIENKKQEIVHKNRLVRY